MATKQFMKIGNVKGNSKDQNHDGWSDVQSVSYGVGNAVDCVKAAKGKSSGSDCTHSNISVKMEIDKSVPELMAYCAVGKCWDKAEFEICEEGEKDPLMKITLDGKVAVTSCSISAESAGAPVVNVGLGFSKITWKYKTDKDLFWDQKVNKGSLAAK